MLNESYNAEGPILFYFISIYLIFLQVHKDSSKHIIVFTE